MTGLFCRNEVSGKAAMQSLQKAHQAGARGCADLLHTRALKHASRDLLRRLLKESQWPGLYWADIPVLDKDTKQSVKKPHPFLLPTDWLPVFMRRPDAWVDIKPEEGSSTKAHLDKVALELQCDPSALVALGLWGDGVSMGGTMNPDSLECFTLNLPTSRRHRAMRVPFTCIQKKHCVPGETFDAIVDIATWSLRFLALGQEPPCKHDGSPMPGQGSAGVGTVMPVQGILTELRGDWAFFSCLYRFPQFNDGGGMCWQCTATYADFRSLSTLDNSWRRNRLTAEEFMVRCRERGPPCTLFSLPGVTPTLAQPDWMHCVDQGIAQDIIGHVFCEVLPEFPGRAKQDQCRHLWEAIRKWYTDNRVPYRFDTMTLSMFVRPGKASKLTGKAACTRHLVPFLPMLCNRFWENGTEHQKSVCCLAQLLLTCYQCLDKAPWDPAGLKKASRQLVNLYCCLEQEALQADPSSLQWRVKPKLHLFEELCQFGRGNPKDAWCYADEDFGGGVGQTLSEERGC